MLLLSSQVDNRVRWGRNAGGAAVVLELPEALAPTATTGKAMG